MAFGRTNPSAAGFWSTVGGNIISGIVVAAFVALLGLGVALLITNKWQVAQARRDRDLAGVVDFYRAYAQFFAIWKVWNSYSRERHPSTKLKELDDGQRFDLLEEASRAEAGIEFMLLRIASEHPLRKEETAALWCLRTAVKQLRYAMRDNHPLNWWRTPTVAHKPGYDAYEAFKGLSSFLARLLVDSSGRQTLPSRRDSRDRHREITGNVTDLPYVKQLLDTDQAFYHQLAYPAERDKRSIWVLLSNRLQPILLAQGRRKYRILGRRSSSMTSVQPNSDA